MAWLVAGGGNAPVLVLGATAEAAHELGRRAGQHVGAALGWYRMTLGRLGATLAAAALAEAGLAPVGMLALEAVCARLVARLGRAGTLGRFAAVEDRPGLPRALARTLDELRLAGVTPERIEDPDLATALAAYEEELAAARLADRAGVLACATEVVTRAERLEPPLGLPLVLHDVPIHGLRERELVAAVAARAPRVLVTVPLGDVRSRAEIEAALGACAVETIGTEAESPGLGVTGGLGRLQAGLFEAAAVAGQAGEDVEVLSAPGESRECVEIARLVRREAERGVPFDRMAILLRAPTQYRAHLEEALRRSGVPAHFAHGTVRPDPAGRSFLSLLACAAEGLSARRFAEYLSLGELPDATEEGAPPPPVPAAERWVPPDGELVPAALERAMEQLAVAGEAGAEEPGTLGLAGPLEKVDPAAPVQAGTLRAPRHWEKLLVEAAVIGGRERWERRLSGLRAELEGRLGAENELDRMDEAGVERTRRTIAELDSLRRYALPLLDALAALPARASWGAWCEQLAALATRALRRPERVLAVLAELSPMAEVGPVELGEVRLVLGERLTELLVPPVERRFGRVFVAPIERARGLAFDVVFVPGLAEKLFPQRVSEDPILRDAERVRLGADLVTNVERVEAERLLLRIAVGAARRRVVLSYPRLDLDQSRPRTPSFYGLEVLRAAEGSLPGFDELVRRAERVGTARVGWPAPASPMDAIDEAEHDLALLGTLLERPPETTVGTARYLLGANPYLARALRVRARRWLRRWTAADGLVDPDAVAREALGRHALSRRSYSPTALQHFAACPYRFLLSAVHRLAPREEPAPLEELDPLERGSLIHEVQFELHNLLRDRGLLPIVPARLEEVRELLEGVLTRVAAHYKERLYPAIERVWDDGVLSVRADLREWLRRAAEPSLEGAGAWVPAHFELSFGLVGEQRARDPQSRAEAVLLDSGLQLRGSIDLVEIGPGGALRATDYKTGKVKAKEGCVIQGGETLQPVLYALVLEKLFPERRVASGRLYYCTATGEFTAREVPLDEDARAAEQAVAKTIGEALEAGFLPAAPTKGACEYCDFRPVCGPHEELRASKVKPPERLVALQALRALR
ncbi:MAG TPA: PD-(D/E)XK nuclease family protein [Polyangia bacterium]|jgi:CRISPR/Cas system-associated exonuclease Cas4 (RecB family)|nr:PD-(D/E)XK nuclease family protein [Polyangia bacterium]